MAALMRLVGQEPRVTAGQIVGQFSQYEYKIELVRLWVERYKALGRVIEEAGLG